jgi:DNA-binding SARP family transcriptional activator/DNA-binding transcriptional regulator YiaG
VSETSDIVPTLATAGTADLPIALQHEGRVRQNLDLDEPATIGRTIRNYRAALGLSQQQLAQAAGVSLGFLRDLEQGRTRSPQWASLEALTVVLRLDLHEQKSLVRTWCQGARRSSTFRSQPVPLPTPADPVRIGILGPLSAERSGERIELGSRRERVVLGLLALGGDHGIRIDELLEVFWPDEEPLSAPTIVQGHVSRVRQLLATETSQSPVIRTGQSYVLQTDPLCQLDSAEFFTNVQRGDTALAASRPDRACHFYRHALDLWRDKTLADLDLLQEHPSVVNLNARRSEVIIRYADAAASASTHAEALPYLRHACSADPFSELIHARLIVALAAAGRRAEAINTFEQLRGRLDRELGIAPCNQLWQAYSDILTLSENGPSRAAIDPQH